MSQTLPEENGSGEVRTSRSSDDTLIPDVSSGKTTLDRFDSSSTMVGQEHNNNNDQSTTTDPDCVDFDSSAEKDLEKIQPTPSTPPPYINPKECRFPPPPPPNTYRHEKLCQKTPALWDHPSMTLGGPMIVLFDIIVPCIIYYTWYNARISTWNQHCSDLPSPCPLARPDFDRDILGLAVISFGLGELYILLARVYRLYFHRDQCAPLLSRAAWELDATSWVYLAAMVCALIPFVVGSTLVIPRLYLYAPSFLMGFLGMMMLASLLPILLPIGINSHARGSRIRPFIYYAAEDFIAVDGLQDREFRVRYNARYDNDPSFRRLFVLLTIWWIIGVCVYILCLTAVIWTVEFHYAFGLSLGLLFAYIATWAGTSYLFVTIETRNGLQRAKELGILSDNYFD